MIRLAPVAALIGALLSAPLVLVPARAVAQAGGGMAPPAATQAPRPRPKLRGRTYKVKIDSSPQQAVVYWDSASVPAPKDYGIAGYTPITLTVPKGNVRVVLELKGFRTQERDIDVRKAQSVFVTMERAPQPARLEIVAASDGSATGADVFIDGVARGTLPNSFEVVAGRHSIEVKKVGWKPAAKWVDTAEDERRTVEITLERAELPTGTLLVTADGPGGDVYVDGVRKDAAPTVVSGLAPGEHIVEVKREGSPPWRQSVTIVSGQQAKVVANIQGSGGLRVVANEAHVQVFIDGDEKGKAPLTISDIRPGQHLVEGRKSGYRPFEQTIEVTAGKQTLVQMKLEQGAFGMGKAMLRVQSPVPDAEVFMDGSSLGKAPIDRRDLEGGKHYITVRKEGYEEFKREVFLIDGQPVQLDAPLRAVGRLRILSNPQGAEVIVDGEPIGKTPLERDDIAAGDHVFVFRLKGYYDHKDTITVVGGKERLVSPDLKPLPSGPTAEERARRKAAMSSFGAKSLPQGGFVADLGMGYPHILLVRLTVGAFKVGATGVDLGVEFQSFFQMNNLAVHGRLQLAETGPLAVGLRASAGGGAGTDSKNTAFFDVAAIASLAFADVVTVSGDIRFAAWSDQFCPSAAQVADGFSQDDYCKDGMFPASAYPEFGGQNPAGQRYGDTRVYAGLSVVAAIDKRLSAFLRLDFQPGAGILFRATQRMAYQDKFNSVMFERDTGFYGNAGISLKF